MQVDDETWAAVRSAYADISVPLADIAARYGVTPLAVGARAKREDWPGRDERLRARPRAKAGSKSGPRKSTAGRRGRKPSSQPGAQPETADADPEAPPSRRRRDRLPTRDARKSIVGRLYRAISLKLEHMEKRMASGKPRSAQDEERESRALATLINNFEKVTEAVAELDQEGAAGRASGRAGTDAERMRREIAERLERLGGRGALERGAGKPRS
jgi:hypothetical protein